MSVTRERPTGYKVEKRLCNDGRWCVAWRSPRMPASSFWYFDTKADADEAFEALDAHNARQD